MDPNSYTPNYDRLLLFADRLCELDEQQFDIDVVWGQKDCGSVGCAMGWAPTIMPELEFHRVSYGGDYMFQSDNGGPPMAYAQFASLAFDIPRSVAYNMFTARPGATVDWLIYGTTVPRLHKRATPQDAANMIRQFVDFHRNAVKVDQ